MLRRLQNFNGKNIDATKKAKVAMVRGLLVQKDVTTGEAVLPVSQEGLFFVDRDAQPTGLGAMAGDVSEYDDSLDKIAAGVPVQLEGFVKGEIYAVDQFVATGFAVGNYAEVSNVVDATQGKIIKKATAGAFRYLGTMTEGTHTLAMVEVL